MTSLEQVGKNYKLESNDFKNDMEAKNIKLLKENLLRTSHMTL